MTDAMRNLVAQKSALLAKANAIKGDDTKGEELVSLVNQIKAVDGQIDAQTYIEDEERKALEGKSGLKPENQKKLFNSFGEQLKAIQNVARGVGMDERLKLVNAGGINENSGPDGGFLVQTEFAGNILESLYKNSAILSRVNVKDIKAEANGVSFAILKETDIGASVAGGVVAYWAAEGSSLTESQPKFAEVTITLEKVVALAYVTDEQLEDSTFNGQFVEECFAKAIDRVITAAILEGDGNKKPLGILKCKGLVTVAKEAGQTAGTVRAENLAKMYNRLLPDARAQSVWVMHPDVAEQLPFLYADTGSYSGQLIYMPAGGFSGKPFATLFGLPIIEDDNCSAVGTLGDVMLCDLSQYIFIRKGGIKTAESIHVQFLTDKTAFRAVYRCNGAPMRDWTITIKNSSKARGAFVALATRA